MAIGREETLRDYLRFRRIPNGLRYLRRNGMAATLRTLFPSLRTYRAWIAKCDTLGRDDVDAIRRQVDALIDPPLISLVMAAEGVETRLIARTVASLAAQFYPHWELLLSTKTAAEEALTNIAKDEDRIKLVSAGADGHVACVNALLTTASGELIALLAPGDELAPHALYLLAAEFAAHRDALLLYSDEDTLDARGRRINHVFKSDWNPDLLLGCDMIGRLTAYRRGLIEQLGGLRSAFDGAEEYDLALRASEVACPQQIRHLPYVLYHRRATAPQAGMAEAQRRALSEHFARIGEMAIEVLPGPTGETHRIIRPLPREKPLVSLVVPVGARLELVRNCLSGVLHRTDYDKIELLVMANAGTKPEVRPYLNEIAADARVTIVDDTGSDFNFSRLCNLGVAQARGEIVGLINDDLQVIEPGWLEEMVSHAVRPEVGAVGAKLYYPDDTIQHAGVVMPQPGAPCHWFRHARRDAPGYCNRLLVTQDLSVVTAACILLRKSVYCEVGGLDEKNLAVAFNDVDLCLRIRAAGYLIVWTPFAELYHMESASRGSDLVPQQIERFLREVAFLAERWSEAVPRDPYYSPNLAMRADHPELAFPPRLALPWRGIVGRRGGD